MGNSSMHGQGSQFGRTFRSLVLGSVVTIAIEFLFFGAYVILFGVCIFIIVRHKRSRRALQMTLMSTLFALATIVTILFVAETVTHLIFHFNCHKYQEKNSNNSQQGQCDDTDADDTWDGDTGAIKLAVTVFFVLTNLLGDGILIYRSYYIWDQSARVTYVPILASIVNNILAMIGLAQGTGANTNEALKFSLWQLYLALNIVLNVFLTLLIAGRVWYIRRQAEIILGGALREKYGMVITLCIESGVLYPISLVIFLSLQLGLSSLDFLPIVVQVMGIAPTLISVRSAMGVSVDNVEQVIARSSDIPLEAIADLKRRFGSVRGVQFKADGPMTKEAYLNEDDDVKEQV